MVALRSSRAFEYEIYLADAIDAKFKSRDSTGSTLALPVFLFDSQMVGSGSLVTPLLGLPFVAGVAIVGVIVILIVATAGMASTTYVQFIKGGLLVIFSLVIVIMLFARGFSTQPEGMHSLTTLNVTSMTETSVTLEDKSYQVISEVKAGTNTYVKLSKDNIDSYWKLDKTKNVLTETQTIVTTAGGSVMYNGAPKIEGKFTRSDTWD
jgi:cation/acetate symporter